MAPPSHVQAVTALCNVFLLVACCRDVFFPGTPLPLPGEDKLMLIWGSKTSKKGLMSAAPVEGVMLMICQGWGLVWATVALCKLITVFTNMQEGTFLRRNLFFVFGTMDMAVAYMFFTFEDFISNAFGASLVPFVALFALEGIVFLQDAAMRPRKRKAA